MKYKEYLELRRKQKEIHEEFNAYMATFPKCEETIRKYYVTTFPKYEELISVDNLFRDVSREIANNPYFQHISHIVCESWPITKEERYRLMDRETAMYLLIEECLPLTEEEDYCFFATTDLDALEQLINTIKENRKVANSK